MSEQLSQPGRLRPAPENFLTDTQVGEVRAGRRDFLRGSLLAATAALAAPLAARASEGDPAILDLPNWSKSVGQSVATRPYGLPSQHESPLQRREMRGLSKVSGNSASFTPLQGLFGIITPSGLHYERHHQGWHDVDPAQHRLMITASTPTLIDKPMVFSMDDLMRLPSVSRIHFLECGGNTGTESAPLVA